MALNRLAQHAAAPLASRATPSAGTVLLRKSTSRSGPAGECDECAKLGTTVQRKAAASANPGIAPPIVHRVLASAGQPLDSATRTFMEPRLGHDFSKVRVHADEHAAQSARAVSSLAYTVAPHIVFAAGQYRPQTESGQRLLAHELTHVVQQRDSGAPSADLRVSRHDDPAEVEAAQAEAGHWQGNGSTAAADNKRF